MQKLDLKKLHIGFEFEFYGFSDGLTESSRNGIFYPEIEQDLGCWEVKTFPIKFDDNDRILEILEVAEAFAKELGIRSSHIHLSHWGDFREKITKVYDGAGNVYRYLLAEQSSLNFDKYGRQFCYQCAKFEPMRQDLASLPFKLSSMSRKHWIAFTDKTVEFRLPVLKSVDQFLWVINDCKRIYDNIKALCLENK